jgi:DNA-binding winged helix-turn-helix (wHTH) protein
MNQSPHDTDGTDSEVFLVGDLRVDVGQQRVTRDGVEITLPNLSLQLLIALIRVAPNVLSHDLLMERVWPGIVVSPETVAKRANLLREALGDDAREPRYIAGVRSRGYQLVAAVSPAARLATPVDDLLSVPVVDTSVTDFGAITTKSSRM